MGFGITRLGCSENNFEAPAEIVKRGRTKKQVREG
jgi:hypothetical protein